MYVLLPCSACGTITRHVKAGCSQCRRRERAAKREAKAGCGRTRRYPAKPARSRRPRSRVPARLGDYRERVKYANELWRKLIYAKEPSGVCPRCSARAWHDAAHCFAKGPYPALRFELENGAPLCRSCHRRVDSDHQAKVEFFLFYLGAEEYERLELMAQSRSKADLGLTILFLEQRAEERPA